MVHGILQFTPSIAFRYVLHRCESRDIRCRESFVFTEEARVPPTHAADGARGAGCRFEHSLALSAPGFVGRPPRAPGRARRGRGGGARAECRSTPPARAPRLLNAFAGSFCCAGFDNDPSAGSPTETLLRLLLPLNDKVQWTSRDVAGSEPPTSPRSEHFTGSFNRRRTGPPDARRGWGARGRLSIQVFLGAFRAGVRCLPAVCASARAPGTGGGARAECRSTPPARTPRLLNAFAGSFCCAGFDNDPSAGSPTETLLRLLLPLNDKVQWTSRDVAGSEPPTSPRSEHFTGSFNR
ncbi:hypothetical protein CQW23_31498 [Capsicum baccatum]|uniref:Uncharacterized protein n=1 Tax=Capsicum baccatum TaxID=33114 RepID=A0A2G2V7D7_CAPBA|nr:hypothetical protein CQW23_31498 [Capsicum baccatum]